MTDQPVPDRDPAGEPPQDPTAHPGPTEAAPPVAVPALSPSPTPTFDLPNARRVVGAGIQLAVGSTGDLRRASIYIGLLVLAALGPAIVYLIAAVDVFDINLGEVFEDMATGGDAFFVDHPELLGVILFVELLALLGGILLVAITVDGQAIAISILAGRAATRPIHLPDAIVRARQVFWRVLGGGFLVGVYSSVIQVLLGLVLGGAQAEPNVARDFIVALIATLATVPFAYVATGIVLGDVGAIESLKRSMTLFRARPTIALVVVLFTLVTAAIEIFALGAGLDLVVRVGEALRLDATAGGAALILPIVLALATVTAFGSLLFTVAALVSAPQVAAFLGLTFYAGGLERARTDGGRPPGFRWVSLPMQLAILVVVGLGVLGVVTLSR